MRTFIVNFVLVFTFISTSQGFMHGIQRVASSVGRISRLPLARRLKFDSQGSRTRLLATAAADTKASALQSLMERRTDEPQFVFVGGKGGVGKTSSSSAIAIALSDAGFRTLIVSTDPAHSLGDALDVNLSSGKVVPITTETNLWALEIDVDSALQEFKEAANGLDADSLASSLGIPKDIIDSFGLSDLASIFTNPPPGIDEIVALTRIFQYADDRLPNGKHRYDRIIIDTAPTGHTIRLLQLPDFLNSITGKLIKFRAKLVGAIDSFKSMFGGGDSTASKQKNSIDGALGKLEDLQQRLARVKSVLTNPQLTQFVVVTIATSLAVAESKRLVQSLRGEGIKVSSILCNQLLSDSAGTKYIDTRRAAQHQSIDHVRNFLKTKLDTEPGYAPVEVTEVPYVDTEVTGIYGLKYFAAVAHTPKANTATNPIDSRKLTIFGGKGGVGKTTSAASWAVQLSESGLKTLVVSTDPAHSLGDAFKEPLTGNPRLLDQNPGSGGQLWAMEIDPEQALDEFKDIMRGALGPGSPAGSGGSGGGAGGFAGAMGLPDFKGEIAELLSGVNDPPPGTDEVVALTKVVTYLEDGFELPNGQKVKLDRIVLDTAPTGHTLRMLQLPEFLQQLLRKLKTVSKKAGALGGMMGMMGGGGGGGAAPNIGPDGQELPSETEVKLDKFVKRMERLEELLHSPKQAEFTVVTIPTELATAETTRLLQSLRDDSIGVRRVIINQVIPKQGADGATVEQADAAATAYLNRLRQGQQMSVKELQQLADDSSVPLVKIPYFDMEVRTVYGLRIIGNFVFPK